MYTKKYFSKTKAVELQQNAKTVTEAVAAYRQSCNMCNAWKCRGASCPVTLAHNQRLAAFEAEELVRQHPVRIIEPRKYTKSLSGVASRACAVYLRAQTGTQKQLIFCKDAAVCIKSRDFGLLEELANEAGVTRGRVPDNDWGKVVVAIRAVLKAAKEI